MAEANEAPAEAARREVAEETRAGIRLRDGELRQHRFVTPEVAASLLRDYVWRRVSAALECAANGTTAYLHNGSRV